MFHILKYEFVCEIKFIWPLTWVIAEVQISAREGPSSTVARACLASIIHPEPHSVNIIDVLRDLDINIKDLHCS